LAQAVQAYVTPVAQRFGWVLLLILPIALVCVVIFSFIAGGLGFGDAVRSWVDGIILGIGALGVLVVVPGILILTYHKKPKIK
jgi:hypothetical protein